MNASHNHRGALELGLSQDSVTRNTIAAADPDADDVSRLENVGIKPFDGFVNEYGVTYQLDGRWLEPARKATAA